MTVNSEFTPSVFHPFYFIRKGLFKGIAHHASQFHGKMLDFGCGSKPYKSLFPVEEYIGLDYENDGHPHENEQIDIFYNGKTIPLPAGEFDCVLCSEVMEHVFNPDEVLSEINRVMKPGAPLLITCPFVWNEHEVPYDYARYTRFALDDILRRHGFEIISFSKSGNFILTIFQMWNLFFYSRLYKKIRNIFFLRWAYKLVIVLGINLGGLLWNFLLPDDKSLYLNNIVLARKLPV
jgi:SAM-dependent methyltransferase